MFAYNKGKCLAGDKGWTCPLVSGKGILPFWKQFDPIISETQKCFNEATFFIYFVISASQVSFYIFMKSQF